MRPKAVCIDDRADLDYSLEDGHYLKMEKRMQTLFRLNWLLALLLLVGCAGVPKKVYISRPEVQKVSNEAFDASIQPLKLSNPFYVVFQLEVQNKTTKPLSIDWNNTRYLYNNVDQGRFVFKGIDPESIKSAIPAEIIPGGQKLSRRIHPLKTLGFMRKRDIPKPGQRNFFPGILPNGINAVVLVVSQGERQWKESLTVRFATKEIP
jgi:hypothetical protein